MELLHLKIEKTFCMPFVEPWTFLKLLVFTQNKVKKNHATAKNDTLQIFKQQKYFVINNHDACFVWCSLSNYKFDWTQITLNIYMWRLLSFIAYILLYVFISWTKRIDSSLSIVYTLTSKSMFAVLLYISKLAKKKSDVKVMRDQFLQCHWTHSL